MNDFTDPVPDSTESQKPPPASAPAGLLAVIVDGLALMAADLVRTHLGRLLQPRVVEKDPVADVPVDDNPSEPVNTSDPHRDSASRSQGGILVAVILVAIAAILFWNHRKK